MLRPSGLRNTASASTATSNDAIGSLQAPLRFTCSKRVLLLAAPDPARAPPSLLPLPGTSTSGAAPGLPGTALVVVMVAAGPA